MNDTENPFQPPAQEPNPRMRRAINWRAFWMLNIGMVVTLAVFFLIALTWANYDQQQLPRRYATYDHEITHHAYPLGGLIMLLSIFAATNLVFFTVQLISPLATSANANR